VVVDDRIKDDVPPQSKDDFSKKENPPMASVLQQQHQDNEVKQKSPPNVSPVKGEASPGNQELAAVVENSTNPGDNNEEHQKTPESNQAIASQPPIIVTQSSTATKNESGSKSGVLVNPSSAVIAGDKNGV
jgi:hypothetical protein